LILAYAVFMTSPIPSLVESSLRAERYVTVDGRPRWSTSRRRRRVRLGTSTRVRRLASCRSPAARSRRRRANVVAGRLRDAPSRQPRSPPTGRGPRRARSL